MDYQQYLEALEAGPIVKEMAFPATEYGTRIDKVRERLEAADLDGMLASFVTSVSYLSGYQAFATDMPAFLLLPREGEPVLVVSAIEIPGALLSGAVEDVRGVDWLSPNDSADLLQDLIRAKGLACSRIGFEPKRPGLSIDIYERMRAGLTKVRFEDASDLVGEVRRIKSSRELDHMRRAASITRKGIEAGLAAVREGATENEIAAPAFEAMVGAGSEYFSTQPIVTAGHRTGWVHTTFKRTVVSKSDTIILEFGAAWHRYSAGIMHTAVVGPVPAQVERFAKVSNEALEQLFAAAAPGRTAHDVARDVKKAMKGLDTETYMSGMFGYSIGLGFPPTWREMLMFITEGNDDVLEPGMTFHSPMSLRVPGELGVGFSETWVVTESGVELLTQHDRSLHVAG
jgi:Xaa-Pro aminopeptidase